MMVHISNPGTPKAEAGASWIWTSLGCIERPWPKIPNQKRKGKQDRGSELTNRQEVFIIRTKQTQTQKQNKTKNKCFGVLRQGSLTLQARLDLNSQQDASLSLPDDSITGVSFHVWHQIFLKRKETKTSRACFIRTGFHKLQVRVLFEKLTL